MKVETYQPRPGDRAWSPLGRFTWRPHVAEFLGVSLPLDRLAVVYRNGVVFTVDRSTGQVLGTTTEEAVLNLTSEHFPTGINHLPDAVDVWQWPTLAPEALHTAALPRSIAA